MESHSFLNRLEQTLSRGPTRVSSRTSAIVERTELGATPQLTEERDTEASDEEETVKSLEFHEEDTKEVVPEVTEEGLNESEADDQQSPKEVKSDEQQLAKRKVLKSDISRPQYFRHVAHVSTDLDGGLQIKCSGSDPLITELLKQMKSASASQLEAPKTETDSRPTEASNEKSEVPVEVVEESHQFGSKWLALRHRLHFRSPTREHEARAAKSASDPGVKGLLPPETRIQDMSEHSISQLEINSSKSPRPSKKKDRKAEKANKNSPMEIGTPYAFVHLAHVGTTGISVQNVNDPVLAEMMQRLGFAKTLYEKSRASMHAAEAIEEHVEEEVFQPPPPVRVPVPPPQSSKPPLLPPETSSIMSKPIPAPRTSLKGIKYSPRHSTDDEEELITASEGQVKILETRV